ADSSDLKLSAMACAASSLYFLPDRLRVRSLGIRFRSSRSGFNSDTSKFVSPPIRPRKSNAPRVKCLPRETLQFRQPNQMLEGVVGQVSAETDPRQFTAFRHGLDPRVH